MNSKTQISSTVQQINDNCHNIISYYDNNWLYTENVGDYINKDAHYSNIQGSALDFTFKGKVIRWIGSMMPNHGIADIYIDWEFQLSVDTYRKKALHQQVLYEKSGLDPNRYHTLRIVVTGKKNDNATDCFINIDAFECEQPVDAVKELKKTAYSQFKTIYNGTKSYLTPEVWHHIDNAADTPLNNVSLDTGPFKTAYENNKEYLKYCYKQPKWIGENEYSWWVDLFQASNEGRLLAGAGHTLRWEEDIELREMVNSIVDAISNRQKSDGYFLPYPESELNGHYIGDGTSYEKTDYSDMDEHRNYDRCTLTRGLTAAGLAGNRQSYDILRKFYDWFNQSSYLAKLLEGMNGTYGIIGGVSVYFSPAGKSADMVTSEKYYIQDWMITELKNENPLCIWRYPFSFSHSYLIATWEAILDHYRATGNLKYLDAAKGGWQIIFNNYEYEGGGMAICEAWEGELYPPKSYYLRKNMHTVETCGSVFWIDFNHRFLLLFPDQEKYAAEIEKNIYNILLAVQDSNPIKGIRYHSYLHGKKDEPKVQNTCCEITATELYGRMHQYIYSISGDGLHINLYNASSIRWNHKGKEVNLSMVTQFPEGSDVSIKFKMASETSIMIGIRIPSWVKNNVAVRVNGKHITYGVPGTYVKIDRIWMNGDEVNFTLPMDFNLVKYKGFDEVAGYDRYVLNYGPILMALVGPLGNQYKETDVVIQKDNWDISIEEQFVPRINMKPENLAQSLIPVVNSPLHFKIAGSPSYKYVPYWQLENEIFTCYPIFHP